MAFAEPVLRIANGASSPILNPEVGDEDETENEGVAGCCKSHCIGTVSEEQRRMWKPCSREELKALWQCTWNMDLVEGA